jgi:hypothetical protein
MEGFHFESREYVQSHVTTVLRGLPENVLQQSFQAWQKRCNACMNSEGKYSEFGHLQLFMPVLLV